MCQAAGIWGGGGALHITAKRPPWPAAVLEPHLRISQMLSCFWWQLGLTLKETLDQVTQIIVRLHINQSEIIVELYSNYIDQGFMRELRGGRSELDMVDWELLARTSDRKLPQLTAKRGMEITNSGDGSLQAWLHPGALPLAASTVLASFFGSILYTAGGRGEEASSSRTARSAERCFSFSASLTQNCTVLACLGSHGLPRVCHVANWIWNSLIGRV